MKKISENLVAFRAKRGNTQEELAKYEAKEYAKFLTT